MIHPVDCTKSMGSCSSLVRPMYFSQASNILPEEYSFFHIRTIFKTALKQVARQVLQSPVVDLWVTDRRTDWQIYLFISISIDTTSQLM